MSTPTHTPGPWEFKESQDNTGSDDGLTLGSIRGTIRGEDYYIARIWNDVPEAQANAAYIVRACNAHDELVKALELARAQLAEVVDMNNPANWLDNSKATLEYLDQALALAHQP